MQHQVYGRIVGNKMLQVTPTASEEDSTVGYCKRNFPAYLGELIKKKKQVGTVTQVGIVSSSDRGSEYISQEFKNYLKAYGIVQHLTPPYTPQHNGVSKRRNHSLLNMVRSMMNLTTQPLSFWDYALETAIRILNLVPTKKDTPDKLQQRFVKCFFIGFPKETMGYYFYFPPENKIVVPRYADFLEKNLISQEVSGRAKELEEIQDKDKSPSKNTSEIPMNVEGFPKETMGYYFYFPPENKIVIARYADFLEKNLISQEVSGRAKELEEIQDKDTSPSKNTSEIPLNVEGFKAPQEEVVLVHRSSKTHRAFDRLCLNVEVEEFS
nr:retrovirus-related Pol polyprotein from transposon TNT 1-94 [Tanacetum cinerariifolium]